MKPMDPPRKPQTPIEKHNDEILKILQKRCLDFEKALPKENNEEALLEKFQKYATTGKNILRTSKESRKMAMQLIYLNAKKMSEQAPQKPLMVDEVVDGISDRLYNLDKKKGVIGTTLPNSRVRISSAFYLDKNTSHKTSGTSFFTLMLEGWMEEAVPSKFAFMMEQINNVHENYNQHFDTAGTSNGPFSNLLESEPEKPPKQPRTPRPQRKY